MSKMYRLREPLLIWSEPSRINYAKKPDSTDLLSLASDPMGYGYSAKRENGEWFWSVVHDYEESGPTWIPVDSYEAACNAAESSCRSRLTAALVPVDVEALASRIAGAFYGMGQKITLSHPKMLPIEMSRADFKQAILEALNTQEQDA